MNRCDSVLSHTIRVGKQLVPSFTVLTGLIIMGDIMHHGSDSTYQALRYDGYRFERLPFKLSLLCPTYRPLNFPLRTLRLSIWDSRYVSTNR